MFERGLADLLFSLRNLRRSPAYAVASILTLALIVAAGGAVYAVMDATMFRPLPFPEASRLVRIFGQPPQTTEPSSRTPLTSYGFVQYRLRMRSLEDLEAFWVREVALGDEGEPESVIAAQVSPGAFALLGGTPFLGRTFSGEEDRISAPLVVLSYGLWQRRFAGDRQIIGRSLLIDRKPYEVIGVMSPDFEPVYNDSQLWTPLGIHEGNLPVPNATPLQSFGRMRVGMRAEDVSREAAALMAEFAVERPENLKGWSATANDFRSATFGSWDKPLASLLIAVIILAAIACANIANLSLARAAGRRSETLLRRALGAERVDLLRLYLSESVIVGGAGLALGLALASFALPMLLSLDVSAQTPIRNVVVNWRVSLVAGIFAVGCSLLSHVVPLLREDSGALAADLAEGTVRTLGSRRSRRARVLLLTVQSALSLVLLVCGALLLAAFSQAAKTKPGYDPENVLMLRFRLPETAYPNLQARAAFLRTLLERIRQVPGVTAASSTLNQLTTGFYFVTLVNIEGHPAPDGQPTTVQFRRVSPGYFRALHIPELAGRTFNDADGPDTPGVAVISQSFAEQYFPGDDPLGRTLERSGTRLTVIGVVGDVRDYDLSVAGSPTLYISFNQNSPATAPVTLVVRAQSDPLALVPALRAAIRSIDPQQPVDRIVRLDSFLRETVGPQRFRSVILSSLALFGLLLSALGIYGTTERSVRERIPEVGIRLALGAAPSGVRRMVMAEALAPVVTGLAIGLGIAAAAVSWLELAFPGVTVTPIPVLVSIAVLIGAATAAAMIPSYRASRVDPSRALRGTAN